MGPSPRGTSDVNDVTVLVFKDNFSSRTFRIPLSWISRFGFALGACAAASLILLFLTVKYYRMARNSNPVRVMELEGELDELRASYKSVEAKASAASLAAATKPAPAPADKPAGAASPVPVPTVTVTATATPSAANPVTPTRATLFSAVPLSKLAKMPDPATLPFKLVQSKVVWRKNTLSVQFAIQYTSEDGGNQQGRIVILARGARTLMTYPEKVMNVAGADSLLQPDQGEYFSVSRFREVKADFGPVPTDTLKTAEVLIFNTQGDLLVAERYNAETPAAPPPAAVKPARKAPRIAPKAAAPVTEPAPGAATGATPDAATEAPAGQTQPPAAPAATGAP